MIDRADFGTGLRAHLRLEQEPPSDLEAQVDVAVPAEAPAAEPPGEAPPATAELLDELARAEGELEHRARELAAAAADLEARERAVAQERERLEALRDELVVRPKAGDDVRTFLRDRAEGSAEWIWRVFEDALTAQGPDGQADHAARVAAARALLAEAYTEPAPAERVWEPFDELR